jgi:hypothetical protein
MLRTPRAVFSGNPLLLKITPASIERFPNLFAVGESSGIVASGFMAKKILKPCFFPTFSSVCAVSQGRPWNNTVKNAARTFRKGDFPS